MAHWFNVPDVIIYANYISCDLKKDDTLGGNHCLDFYNYLKKRNRRFSKLQLSLAELRPKYDIYQLDRLFETSPLLVLNKEDQDELYQHYDKLYPANNLADFYVWLADNYCYLIPLLIKKLDRLYKTDNPFINDYYFLDVPAYLYNRHLIQSIPRIEDVLERRKKLRIQPNRYRITSKER